MTTTPSPKFLSPEDLDAMRSRDAACVPDGPRWNLNNSVDHNDAAHAVRDRHKLFEHVAALEEHIEALRSICREHHEAKGTAYAQLKSTEAALAQVVKERAEEKAAADRLRGEIATELGFYPPQGDDHLVAQVANVRTSLTTASKMRDQAFDALQRVGELVSAPGGSSYFDAPKHVEAYKRELEEADRDRALLTQGLATDKEAADKLRKQVASALRIEYRDDEQLHHCASNVWALYVTAQQDTGRANANAKQIASERDQALNALKKVNEIVLNGMPCSPLDIPKHVETYMLEREKAAHEASIALGNLDARVQELTAKHREAVDCAATFERACERMAKTIEDRDATIRELRERCNRDDQDVTIHECPAKGSGLMPCCGKSPLEVRGHRMTNDPRFVNCDRILLAAERTKSTKLRDDLAQVLGQSLKDDEIVAKVRKLYEGNSAFHLVLTEACEAADVTMRTALPSKILELNATIETLSKRAEEAEQERDDYARDNERTSAANRELIAERDALLNEEPLPNGTFPHLLHCNGNRRKPPGTPGIGCSCKTGRGLAAGYEKELASLRDTESSLRRILDEACRAADVLYHGALPAFIRSALHTLRKAQVDASAPAKASTATYPKPCGACVTAKNLLLCCDACMELLKRVSLWTALTASPLAVRNAAEGAARAFLVSAGPAKEGG